VWPEHIRTHRGKVSGQQGTPARGGCDNGWQLVLSTDVGTGNRKGFISTVSITCTIS
ncbi:uncharacterized protein CCOS01_05585, partial [Colletotrichum costaricense]